MSVVRKRSAGGLFVGIAFGIAVVVTNTQSPPSATYYVDINNPKCADAQGSGSESTPYCTLNYVTKIAVPGDTFLFKNGRYGGGPQNSNFTKTGTAIAPITYRAIGNDVVIGGFDDVRDEDFQPTTYPNVYVVTWTKTFADGYRLYQTFFDPILVDDPNATIFTMRQEDGPLFMVSVKDYATLTNVEGTWLYDSGKIYVHPYSNRVPRTTTTDLVIGHRLSGNLYVDKAVQYNVFDGFRITYSSSTAFQIDGSNNRLLNLKMQAVPLQVRGNNNYAENITVTHVIARGPKWLWHEHGEGRAIGVYGNGHKLQNIHIYHNWNSSISNEDAQNLVVDGLRAHGAPNHCGSVGTNNTVRNVVQYNCQDYFYLHEKDNVLIEHATVPSGIAVQAIKVPMGKVTVRNSILGSGSWGYSPSVSKAITCAWEVGSLFENNVISTSATIRHCADHIVYPMNDYIAKCQSRVLTNCMTIRNNKMVSDFRTVIKDGMWNAALGDNWDVTLVANSPAIDGGTVSGATRDIVGISRPRGSAFDIGAYEFCLSNCGASLRMPTGPADLRILR